MVVNLHVHGSITRDHVCCACIEVNWQVSMALCIGLVLNGILLDSELDMHQA